MERDREYAQTEAVQEWAWRQRGLSAFGLGFPAMLEFWVRPESVAGSGIDSRFHREPYRRVVSPELEMRLA